MGCQLPSTVMLPPAMILTFDLLTGKPNQYVSWCRYMWPNFGEISSNSYKGIVFTRFFGSSWPL